MKRRLAPTKYMMVARHMKPDSFRIFLDLHRNHVAQTVQGALWVQFSTRQQTRTPVICGVHFGENTATAHTSQAFLCYHACGLNPRRNTDSWFRSRIRFLMFVVSASDTYDVGAHTSVETLQRPTEDNVFVRI
ncbi:hypothetical protein BaRGS_00013029 [Batillaria attramentaria]|uniref:Uncharacterized protein n=1 Tax=Batillaria attramentaria TaxID=370345 RepID=A0ABD0L8C5_9CAEN